VEITAMIANILEEFNCEGLQIGFVSLFGFGEASIS
jgi:hypothetical protein